MNIWKDRNFKPMLLDILDKPFNSKDYFFEFKFDGIRALIFVNKKSIYIQSRNCKDLTDKFPELEVIKKFVNKDVIFDGELVAFNDGKPSFGEIQKRLHIKDKNMINSISKSNPITFVVFDILYEGKDLTNLKLIERKKYLNKYKDSEEFVKTKVFDTNGEKLFNSVKKLNLEGIVAKNKNGLYHINKRTDDFIKIKNILRDEFFIGGYKLKKDGILSLSIGEFVDEYFHYVGNVSIRENSKIYDKVLKSKISKNYFCDFDENINFIKPNIKCFVEYLERTSSNHLRHPIYKEF